MEEGTARCPHCRSAEHLSTIYALRLSLEDWPLMLAVILVIVSLAALLSLEPPIALAAAGTAIIPLGIQLLRRFSCERCGVDFYPADRPRPAPGQTLSR